jgi:hypothetical protein
MSFEEALRVATRDDRFRATVYAMNTILIQKGVYTKEEYRTLFVEWIQKQEQNADTRGSLPEAVPCEASA